MQLTPIEGKNCHGHLRLILLSSGALLLIKQGTPVVTMVVEGDDIDFALDFLLCFIAESHRRRAYNAWKQENGFDIHQRRI